ncbi:gamma-glutamylcyclotransferase family protein [Sphingosinicella sp.]|uniref:gamma-glutamylcyclotransferase family protein n=1 Tax=Sphingosinicella sp. TaxID=1917971 RepID=UPI004037EEFF
MFWIFSYGTLRQPEVQIGLFGRRLEGEEDTLGGYVTRLQRVTDSEVIALSGAAEHPALIETGDPADQVDGWALAVNDAELDAADAYEAASRYRRMPVRLKSGRDAFVYALES